MSKVQGYWDWMARESRLAGFCPYHYDHYALPLAPTPGQSDINMGASDFPKTMALMHELGKIIVNNSGGPVIRPAVNHARLQSPAHTAHDVVQQVQRRTSRHGASRTGIRMTASTPVLLEEATTCRVVSPALYTIAENASARPAIVATVQLRPTPYKWSLAKHCRPEAQALVSTTGGKTYHRAATVQPLCPADDAPPSACATNITAGLMRLPSESGLLLLAAPPRLSPASLPTHAAQSMSATLWTLGADGQLVPAQQLSLSFGGFPPLTTRERCLQGTSAAGPLLTPATMGTVTLSDGGAVSAFLGVVADDTKKCHCCRSVLFFRQEQRRNSTWRFISRLRPAIDAAVNTSAWGDDFGHGTLVRLPSGSVMGLFSVGKCGRMLAQSTTRDGVRWSRLTFPPQLWGTSPQLLALSNGVLALTAGGPGLALWLSRSEGDVWEQHNLACLYNSMQWNISLRFDGEMRRAVSPTTGAGSNPPQDYAPCGANFGGGVPETSGYTALAEIEPGVLLVAFDRRCDNTTHGYWWCGSINAAFGMRLRLEPVAGADEIVGLPEMYGHQPCSTY